MSIEEDDILESAIPAEIPGVLFQAIADDLMDEYKSFVPGPGRIKARRAAVRVLGTLMAFYEQVEKGEDDVVS